MQPCIDLDWCEIWVWVNTLELQWRCGKEAVALIQVVIISFHR